MQSQNQPLFWNSYNVNSVIFDTYVHQPTIATNHPELQYRHSFLPKIYEGVQNQDNSYWLYRFLVLDKNSTLLKPARVSAFMYHQRPCRAVVSQNAREGKDLFACASIRPIYWLQSRIQDPFPNPIKSFIHPGFDPLKHCIPYLYICADNNTKRGCLCFVTISQYRARPAAQSRWRSLVSRAACRWANWQRCAAHGW